MYIWNSSNKRRTGNAAVNFFARNAALIRGTLEQIHQSNQSSQNPIFATVMPNMTIRPCGEAFGDFISYSTVCVRQPCLTASTHTPLMVYAGTYYQRILIHIWSNTRTDQSACLFGVKGHSYLIITAKQSTYLMASNLRPVIHILLRYYRWLKLCGS